MDENKNKAGRGSGSSAGAGATVGADGGSLTDDDSTETHVIATLHRGQRFSKKLKRRLTIRTIAEAKALKKQSKEAIHVLFYAAELVRVSFY